MKSMTSDQQQSFHRKTTGFLVLVVGCLLIACLGILVKFADLPIIRNKIQTKTQINQPRISVKGSPICLQLKNGEKPSSCEIGIKSTDGEIYAINSQNSGPLNIYSEVGTNISEVSGRLIKAGPKEKFDIVGTIVTDS